MNILVLLQAIRDPRSFTVNGKAQKVFVHRDDFICNPSDKNALEAALRIADPPHPNAHPERSGAQLAAQSKGRSGEEDASLMGVRVIVVAFGTAPSETMLRDALAVGADRAILVRDELLHNVEAGLITLGLQRVIEKLGGVDLVLLGAEVVDGDQAQVGPRLAVALGWPLLPELHQVELAEAVARGIARHPKDNAFHRVETDLPAVAPIARDSNKPRYANAARVITTFSTPDAVEVWSAADLGLTESDLTPLTESRGESFPPERELGKRLEGDVMAQLAEIIRKH